MSITNKIPRQDSFGSIIKTIEATTPPHDHNSVSVLASNSQVKNIKAQSLTKNYAAAKKSAKKFNTISNTTELFNVLSTASTLWHSAYGINMLDGILSIALGGMQIATAKDAKRHTKEKVAWGAVNASMGSMIISTEILSALTALGVFTGIATLGASIFSGVVFTSGMAIALTQTIRKASLAYQKLEPEYLMQDRLLKYQKIEAKIAEKTAQQKEADLESDSYFILQNEIDELNIIKSRLKNQAEAIYLTYKETITDTCEINNTSLTSYLKDSLKIDTTAQPTQPQRELAKIHLDKQAKKYNDARHNILLLATGMIGIGVLTVGFCFPALLPAGIILTGIASIMGGFSLAKKFIYDNHKEKMLFSSEKAAIIQKQLGVTCDDAKGLSEKNRETLFKQLCDDADSISNFAQQDTNIQIKVLNKFLKYEVEQKILREQLNLSPKDDIDEIVSQKEQKQIIRDYACGEYRMAEVTKHFLASAKTTIAQDAKSLTEALGHCYIPSMP